MVLPSGSYGGREDSLDTDGLFNLSRPGNKGQATSGGPGCPGSWLARNGHSIYLYSPLSGEVEGWQPMIDLSTIGKVFLVLGMFLVGLGGLLLLFGHLPYLGRLPGDINIQRKGLNIYIPLASCVVLSVILTIIVNLFLRRR